MKKSQKEQLLKTFGNQTMLIKPQSCEICSQPLSKEWFEGRLSGYTSWLAACPSCMKEQKLSIGHGKGRHFTQGEDGVITEQGRENNGEL
jgi:hypothetical protein